MSERATFKVWIEIERFNETTGEGEPCDMLGASVATFDTYDQAVRFSEHLADIADRSIAGRMGLYSWDMSND